MNNQRRLAQRGVTLVETLVALAVMGFVIAAQLTLVGQNTRFTTAMQERMYAGIAADNLMVEALIDESVLELGEFDGTVTVSDREWLYRKSVNDAGVNGIVRIDIEIIVPASGQVVASATTMRRLR